MATPAPGRPNGTPSPLQPPPNVPGPANPDPPSAFDEVDAFARLGFVTITLLKEKGYLSDGQAAPCLDQLRFVIAQQKAVPHG